MFTVGDVSFGKVMTFLHGDRGCIFVASAETAQELSGIAAAFAAGNGGAELGDTGPANVDPGHRLVVMAPDRAGAVEGARLFGRGVPHPSWVAGRAAFGGLPVAWCFGGHGGQWAGMGTGPLDGLPEAAAVLGEIDEAAEAEAGVRITQELRGLSPEGLDDPAATQPLIFAVQVAMARTFLGLGLRPDAVYGHSMGEVAAAHVAGVLSLPDAVRVICHRSRLLARVPGGGRMLVARVDAATAERACADSAGRISVAVYPSPLDTVLTGDADALRELVEKWEADGVRCRWVRINAASHSPAVDRVGGELRELLRTVRPRRPRHPWRSTVTPEGEPAADAGYWVANLRRPVRFAQATSRLLDEGARVFVEFGPHPVLRVPITDTAAGHGAGPVLAVATGRGGVDERAGILRALAELYCHGAGGVDRRLLLGFHAGHRPS
uniref:AtaPKS1 protein n=1 Tax=Saccharothrix mutabilis subsp. capreolus TaxID=66854 RepID=Q8RJX4_STRMP|nr:AtaPKS1 protein [Saccharothrix mutabilis subsp. capreolus]